LLSVLKLANFPSKKLATAAHATQWEQPRSLAAPYPNSKNLPHL